METGGREESMGGILVERAGCNDSLGIAMSLAPNQCLGDGPAPPRPWHARDMNMLLVVLVPLAVGIVAALLLRARRDGRIGAIAGLAGVAGTALAVGFC